MEFICVSSKVLGRHSGNSVRTLQFFSKRSLLSLTEDEKHGKKYMNPLKEPPAPVKPVSA